MARDAAALVEGRSIPVQRSGASGRETVRARVDGADGEGGLFEVISTALSNACTGQSSARFASFDAQAVTNASLTADAIRAQTDELCRGYFFLGLAEAVAPTELVPGPTTDETRFVVRRPGDGIDSAASILTIPILTGSDAATAALVAVSHFQAAALAGRELLVDQNIAPEVFGTTLPSGDDERVTLAFVLVTQTVEAAQLIETASEVATGQIAGAAQARLASDSDHVRARIESWRARHDSRLEMAAVLGGVPEALFEPEPTSTADAALVSSEERLPAISWMPSRDSERRAVDLLRASRVDPRTGGEMTVARRLRLVMQRDYPDSMPVVTDDADFLRRIGVTDSEQALAANFLVEAAAALGRPIVRESTAEPHQVSGTGPAAGDGSTIVMTARTFGAVTTDDGDIAADSDSFPPDDYCRRGVIQTLQCVADALGKFHPAGISDAAHTVGEFGESGIHSQAPRFAHVCVGGETLTTAGDPPVSRRTTDTVRLRLIGVPRLADGLGTSVYWAARTELWWGDEGVACATDATAPTAACLSHRISAPLTRLDYADDVALEWTIDAAHLPPGAAHGSRIPAGSPIYVTHRETPTGARTPITGFLTETGSATGSFSRCTFLPVGPKVLEAIQQTLTRRGADLDPAVPCSGLPDGPLPLEDVLTEAGTSGGFMEAAFLHYIDRADTAAARAEALGERLIAEQLEMDSLAERSIARLNQICGTTLSAGRVSITPPNLCDADTPCPPGIACESGRCRSSALDLVDAAPEDLARLRRCLSDDGPAAPVTLGERPLCAWMYGGELCACDDELCPPCPARASADGATAEELCGDAFDVDATLGQVIPPTAEIFVTRPLGLVEPRGTVSQSSASECHALAQLRQHQGTTEELLAQVRASPWFTHSSIAAVAGSLSMRRGIGEFTAVARSGRPWISTGSLWEDPSTASASACVATVPGTPTAFSNLCGGTPSLPYGRSPRCGWGGCGTWEARAATSLRLERALRALQLISGVEPRLIGPSLRHDPSAFAAYSAQPLPTWLETGVLETWRREADDDSQRSYGYCTRTDPPGALDVVRYADCDGFLMVSEELPSLWAADSTAFYVPTARFDGTHTYYSGDPRSTALAFWVPSDSLPLRTRREVNPVYTFGTLDGEPYGKTTLQGLLRVVAAGGRPIPNPVTFGAYHRQYRTGICPIGGACPMVDLAVEGPVTHEAVLDGLELACMALEDDVGGCPADLEDLPRITSPEDLDRLETQVDCVASRFDRVAERLIFLDVPELVAADISASRITGTYPSYSGEYGRQVATLRQQMESVVAATRHVGSVVRDVAGDLALARSHETTANIEGEVRSLELLSQISSHLSRCLASAAPTVGSGVSYNTGSIFVCADAILQVVVAGQMARLRDRLGDEELRQARVQTSMQLAGRVDQIASATQLLAESFAGISGTFATMETLRNEGRRELSHALFMDRDDVGQEWAMGRAMRGRHNRTRAQYEEAHRAAVQLAWLARRAIEQRIGHDLSEMDEEMTLVDPPSTWADSVCTTTGVDFWDVWGSDMYPDEILPRGIQTVADYVARLRLFLDSYMQDYPFENSQDVVLLSLRDDFASRGARTCAMDGWNLLSETESAATDDVQHSWEPACGADVVCPVVASAGPGPFVVRDASTGRPSRALGGGTEYRFSVTCPGLGGAAICGGTSGAGGQWGQKLSLRAGSHYRLSWYERVRPDGAPDDGAVCSGGDVGPPRMVPTIAATVDGESPAATLDSVEYVPVVDDVWIDPCRWRRVAVHVSIPSGGSGSGASHDYYVALGLGSTSSAVSRVGVGQTEFAGSFAAPQLEEALASDERSPGAAGFAVMPYFPTRHDGTWPIGTCDERGASDLAARFRYTCAAAACPEGIGTACISDPDFDPDLQVCYWETEFDISLADIERGITIPNGGFAVGNFNYRFDALAANVVGVGIRDCSGVGRGSAGCYASGFLPVSVYHTGGWEIRNHDGERFEMSIFPGAIVSGNALAAERYLTSPLSGTDRSLLTDAWSGEFRGRPLNGHFVLRIHDVPGLDFNAVEDVQLAISYRYWTRQE